MDLNVKREYGHPELPWKVVGVEDDDVTVLYECNSSEACVRFLTGYTRRENAGNWDRIAVVDTRSEPIYVLRMWEREED